MWLAPPPLAACAVLLAACAAHDHHNQLASGNEQQESHGIVSRSTSNFEPNVPEECLKIGFCEDVPDYPEDHVQKIIENLGATGEKYYNVDEMDTPEMDQRTGGEKMEICGSTRRVIMPRVAQDEHTNWYFIVNQKNRPTQRFVLQLCTNSNAPCATDLVYFYNQNPANCKQKFVYRVMAALDRDGTLVQKKFPIPSCCTCIIEELKEIR